MLLINCPYDLTRYSLLVVITKVRHWAEPIDLQVLYAVVNQLLCCVHLLLVPHLLVSGMVLDRCPLAVRWPFAMARLKKVVNDAHALNAVVQ